MSTDTPRQDARRSLKLLLMEWYAAAGSREVGELDEYDNDRINERVEAVLALPEISEGQKALVVLQRVFENGYVHNGYNGRACYFCGTPASIGGHRDDCSYVELQGVLAAVARG